ncbi:MAG: 4Fe-4S dicluster domain-containing protein [Proteobacteria bacterium]|nr:4Fe-4S dicluster domain-containing protein [Pseudomonadota bacterium]
MNAPNFPTIQIDAEKCTTPFDCKLCLTTCPTAVFAVAAIKVVKGQETDPKEPGAYGIGAPHRDKCTGCDDCLEVCPEEAITITFPA